MVWAHKSSRWQETVMAKKKQDSFGQPDKVCDRDNQLDNVFRYLIART